jgi:ubiquinone/menaquinone biosynthesis C-methylase UbiE
LLPAAIERLPEEGLLLDVGGWAAPLARADWVIDLMPYATRGLYGKAENERFDASTWIEHDICTPWPFADGQFDFAVCSHTLEDIRDPIFACQELQRVARAGYVEVPSRIEEQMTGVNGSWPGWAHHRWVIEIGDDAMTFVHKSHAMPAIAHAELPPERRNQWLWWEGSFVARERIFTSIEEHDAYFADALRAIV